MAAYPDPLVDVSLFDQVADVLRGMVPPDLGELRCRPRRWGIKVWFGSGEPPREHYEAQVIGAKYVADAEVLALEIGFHAEHPNAAANDKVIAQLLAREKQWRKQIGKDAVVGPFLGRAPNWRRVSEAWADPDLGEPDLAVDVAATLTGYITALEAVR